ncbi:MAG: bifunctional ornithine acetyltransferase/N-acetylglutamate synthase, partial [Deferrisomatales bacterium]|nr:bifunctional ornithine acetyltransferase/N-acetylglutamate synthase [Deferrisomatales bacterium]
MIPATPPPLGFRFGAVEAAVKAPGRLDMGCILCDRPAAAAGVFTRNRVVAAPVTLCRERVPSAAVRAVLVNAGNANACTGEEGFADAVRLCAAAADALGVAPEAVLPCSTGVIGLPLPMQRMVTALPALEGVMGRDPEPFARCILTTDTCAKVAARSVPRGHHEIRVLGIAKGSGMIRPDMATMLGFLVTDAPAGPELLQQILGRAAERTFNRITVDG